MEDDRKFPNFRDEVADQLERAIANCVEQDVLAWELTPFETRSIAREILTRLRQLGAFHVDALTAIKEQEKE